MTIDFGKVENYVKDRGFGFVSHTFSGVPSNQVFFHIKVVRRTHPELAQALGSGTTSGQMYFWYEYQTSPKGHEVVAILSPQQVHQNYGDQLDAFVATIKAHWTNLESQLPDSLRKATVDLLTANEINELAERKACLEAERNKRQDEVLRTESARRQQLAQARAAQEQAEAVALKAIFDERTNRQRAADEEFLQLVAEFKVLGFTHSSQVSNYIVNNSLGRKYEHISGILEMESQGKVWAFNGGFPPKIYRRLCEELGLENQGSRALATKFTPYIDIIH